MSDSHNNGWRLNKFLASSGVAARRKCDTLIFEGKVTLNGVVASEPYLRVRSGDRVAVEGHLLPPLEERLYFVLNKPLGYICSCAGSSRQRLVLELFEEYPQRLFTVGRLDKETEGLLLITNDGDFANRVIHPSAQIAKEYLVKAEEELSHEHLVAMSHGTIVEGVFVKPKSVSKVRRGTFRIVVYEGKKHEVRLIAAAAGLTVRSLCRIRLGGLSLGSLEPGQWRSLREQEREAIF